MRKVPSHLPLSISSAWVRLMSPTYQVHSSWWGEPSSSSSEKELKMQWTKTIKQERNSRQNNKLNYCLHYCQRCSCLHSWQHKLRSSHLLISIVLYTQPFIDLLLPRPLLRQPSEKPEDNRINAGYFLCTTFKVLTTVNRINIWMCKVQFHAWIKVYLH